MLVGDSGVIESEGSSHGVLDLVHYHCGFAGVGARTAPPSTVILGDVSASIVAEIIVKGGRTVEENGDLHVSINDGGLAELLVQLLSHSDSHGRHTFA